MNAPAAILISVLCMSGSGFAQSGDEKPPAKGGGVTTTDLTGDVSGETETVDLTGEVPNVANGDAYCATMVALRPRRLAPGQSGEMCVVVTLTPGGKAVVVPGSHAQLTLAPDSGPLSYGAVALDPAKKGQLPTKFLGKPIYDDALVFRVPVTIRKDAGFQKFHVTGSVDIQFNNAESGAPIGRFTTVVDGRVWIGAPLPTPLGVADRTQPKRADTDKAVQPAAETHEVKDNQGSVTDANAKRTMPGAGIMHQPDGDTEPDHGADTTDPNPLESEIGPDTSSRLLLWSALGGVALLIVIVLARRR